MNQPYIYKITNLITGRVYVGQHDGSKPSYFASGVLIRKALKKYGESAFNREILCSGSYSQAELDALEIHHIEQERSYYHDYPDRGYNLNRGGGGQRGYVPTSATRQHLRIVCPMNKPVMQFDKQGNHIASFRSIKHAADTLGIQHPSIYRACTGEVRTAGGFCWAFKDGYTPETPVLRESKVERRVAQYGLDGQLIEVHSSVQAAAEAIEARRSGIANALLGIRPTASLYQWRYADEDPAPFIGSYDRSASVSDAATSRTQPVLMLALDGSVLREFASCVEAAAFMVSAVSGVRNCCIGKSKSHKGYRFAYKSGTAPRASRPHHQAKSASERTQMAQGG